MGKKTDPFWDPAGSHELPTVQLTAATWAERCGIFPFENPWVSWENGPHMDTNGGFFTSMLVYRRVCNDQRGISYPRFEELEVLLLMISIDILLPSSNRTDWYGKPVYYIPPGCLGLCILSSIFTLGISCMFHREKWPAEGQRWLEVPRVQWNGYAGWL